MPRKSQANMKTVELIDRINIEEGVDTAAYKGEPEGTLENKIRMWIRAWISEYVQPDPESRVSYTVTLGKQDDPVFPYHCYVQFYCRDGFIQGFETGKDTRQAVKRSLKSALRKLNEIRSPHRVLILPRGFEILQAS
ncbi:MAG: hypothetical protein KDD22_07180 [Bdellovibrionales bacterium]|nr:hypothetical protein [Bdellovibrionales bacterium]